MEQTFGRYDLILTNIIGLFLLTLASLYWFAEMLRCISNGLLDEAIRAGLFGIGIFLIVAVYISLTPQ